MKNSDDTIGNRTRDFQQCVTIYFDQYVFVELYIREISESFLVYDQRDAPLFSMYLFLTLYMFRARRAHHQERQIVSIQPLVAVTPKIIG